MKDGTDCLGRASEVRGVPNKLKSRPGADSLPNMDGVALLYRGFRSKSEGLDANSEGVGAALLSVAFSRSVVQDRKLRLPAALCTDL